MYERPFLLRFTFWHHLIRLAILLGVIWQIGNEFYRVTIERGNLVSNEISMSTQLIVLLVATAFGLGILGFVYICYIFWFAQFIFPVTSFSDRVEAAWRLLLFAISAGHWHGPAIFVRDGEITGTTEELEKTGLGVAFVDLRSAITLDKHLREKRDFWPANLENREKVHFDRRSKTYVSDIRVAGPGLTFTKRKEKIAGAVDLRNQNRSRKDVMADTRDGIRVKTDISCTFTIGQPPDILDVCQSTENLEEILVIEWDTRLPLQYKKVNSLSKELHEDDAKEIQTFILAHPDPTRVVSDVSASQFPFSYDTTRVEKAVYSKTFLQDPTSASNQFLKNWSDWPQDVAAEKFRILLARWPYLNLYAPDDPTNFPFKDFKKELFRQVRNTGILAYRYVTLPDGTPPKMGQEYRISDLVYYPPRHLARFDVLRHRGIKVISVSVGELEPEEEGVRARMMQSWLSVKQKEADLKLADYELEIARVKKQAYIRTQQSMIYHLTQLLENHEYTREALIILIYQELAAIAANPETRRLLPDDTLSLLTGIGTILVPNGKTSGQAETDIPIIPPAEAEP